LRSFGRRKTEEDVTFIIILRISSFKSTKMRTQAHHGGDKYTRVDIGILMGNTNTIVGDIEKYLLEIMHPLKEAGDTEISDLCDPIKRVLNMLDGIFSILRKKHGEVNEANFDTYKQSPEQAVLLTTNTRERQ
jgi:hypothetical protein